MTLAFYIIAFTIIFVMIVLLVMISDDDTIEYCNLCGRRIHTMEDGYCYRIYDNITKQGFAICRNCANKYDSDRYHIYYGNQ